MTSKTVPRRARNEPPPFQAGVWRARILMPRGSKRGTVIRFASGHVEHPRILGYVQGLDGRWYARRSMRDDALSRVCTSYEQAVEIVQGWPPVSVQELYGPRRSRRQAPQPIAA